MPKLKPSDLEIQNSNTRAIINYCQEHTRITDDELAKKLGCSKRTDLFYSEIFSCLADK